MKATELKALRERLGMTQEQLADALGLTALHVSCMERGAKKITARTIASLEMLVRVAT